MHYAAALVVLSACAPAPTFHAGPPIAAEQVKRIEPGRTTREQALQAFGMPLAIVTSGQRVVLARGVEWRGANPQSARFEQAQDRPFFEPFTTGHTLGRQHRVYYYEHRASSRYAVVLGLYIRETVRLASDRLWLLVNEQTGVVEDFVYRPDSGS